MEKETIVMDDDDDDVVELFTEKEKDEIELNISQLIDEFIQHNPLAFSFDNFNNLFNVIFNSRIALKFVSICLDIISVLYKVLLQILPQYAFIVNMLIINLTITILIYDIYLFIRF